MQRFALCNNILVLVYFCAHSENLANFAVKVCQVTNQLAMKIFVETERLILREILPTDVDDLWELDSDPEVHKYLGNKAVKDKQKIIEIINYIRQQYVDNGIGRWAIIDKLNNEFIGWTGLKIDPILTNNHQNYYDLGFRIKSKHWGKGYATETAQLSLAYGFDKLNIKTIYAAASCENTASNKVLKRVGLNFIETFFYEEIKCNWYKLDKSEFDNKKLQRKIG